jgi:hypothetical protein
MSTVLGEKWEGNLCSCGADVLDLGWEGFYVILNIQGNLLW